MAKVASKQRSGQLLLKSGDSRDITIKFLQAQLAEMTQILIDNKLIKPAQIAKGRPYRGSFRGLKNPPRGACWEKRHESHVDLESQGDSKSMTSSKRRVSP